MDVACVKLAVDELLNQSAFSSDNNNCPIIYILLAISKTEASSWNFDTQFGKNVQTCSVAYIRKKYT